MIRLSGFEPGRDIEIKYVGLRPGEKLYEELLTEGEDVESTEHPRVRVVRRVDAGVASGWIEAITSAVKERDAGRVVSLLCTAVPEFTPSELVLPSRGRSVVQSRDRP